MEIGTIWIIIAAIVILLEMLAIWHIIGSERRAERKMLWIVFVVYAPIPGLIVWAWMGPRAVKGRAVLQEK
ncbi:PLD nuclease N-terminal domain-containing protein [Pseudomonas guariconensis]|uniref:PLD nuclease N-terminal domain-containing protein n=1 Tax=Pseudomonas TaxID=286 RepID=UPI001CE4824E|nr:MULTISPECIES: PLD nuclease N-terminal domain-containing protein [Pseudomonas]MCO7643010.1 PLD nuclease N-terminal domain-containing protein [Pseudomonas sp. S 311-6]MCO7517575.1 PLD nuclease N-terminal domain-containing protein [Pseudomonas putida]MCO7567657.1 PLD nuclease N-terminal domain-containing protein [Pseudomonas mosselii]MCO7596259.1 PLD nuclease N-terminal domain-containing protein [Pseudomonas guariconensis]MCO7608031.1 PLD nuclease N-terminal domain-containing protein [Pseudomo